MKKVFSVFLILSLFMMLLPLGTVCFAEEAPTSGTTGECSWSLDDTTLTISGEGAMEDYSAENPAPWGAEITSVIIENGVTSIGAFAFYPCEKLEEATISATAVSIHEDAFVGCKALKAITVDEQNESFYSEEGILFSADKTELLCYPAGKPDATYSINGNVISVGNKSFYGCENLQSITIPKSIVNIGKYSFYGCTGIKEIILTSSVSVIGESAFNGCENLECFTLTNSVKIIGEGAFDNCPKLKKVYFHGETAEKSSVAEKSSTLKNAAWFFFKDGKYLEEKNIKPANDNPFLIFIAFGMIFLKFLGEIAPAAAVIIAIVIIFKIVKRKKAK